MDNQYFTPSIEDIRIGYEIEECVDELTGEFRHRVLDMRDFEYKVLYYIDEWGGHLYRIPHLTIEQIEAEGWIIIEEVYKGFKFAFKKGNYFGMMLQDGRIELVMADILKDEYTEQTSNGRLYLGECKDINTFRYICKLLKIN